MYIDKLVVVAIDELIVAIKYKCKSASHAGAKVDTRFAKHRNAATGHVLAGVITGAFNHGCGTGVSDRKALSGEAGGIQLTTSGAVQTGVADDGGIVAVKA